MPLFVWIIAALGIFALGGVIIKMIFDRTHGPEEVTWREYCYALIAATIFIGPLVGFVGEKLAIRDLLTFREYWNGWEAEARIKPIECDRDGPCVHEYSCDPYTVLVSYSCGKSTCMRSETRYHHCPWVKTEYTYVVDTTLGPYTIDANRFPVGLSRIGGASINRFPEWEVENAGVGEPAFWTEAKTRIDQANPGPVTKVNEYMNYVLASPNSILKRYGGLAEEYGKQKLLPDIGHGIFKGQFYRGPKASVVGCPLGSWNDAVERLNGALGSEREGDLRLVLVCDARVTNPDKYRFALEADWQNTARFERSALPKNAIVVILGTTDGKTVAWGRAFTGMPIGNEALETAVMSRFRASQGVAWSPDAVLGRVVGQVSRKGKEYVASSQRTEGALSDILWGKSDPATAFRRVSMDAKEDRTGIGTGLDT